MPCDALGTGASRRSDADVIAPPLAPRVGSWARSPDTGQFVGNELKLGARGDSYYEYLLKQDLQTGAVNNRCALGQKG